MLSPTWGVYSGYELYEHLPVRPGSEEYLDSEKVPTTPADYAAAEADGRSLAPLLTRLNEIRRQHRALHWLGNLRFHQIDNDSITVFSKREEATDDEPADTILVVCSTDPHNVREGWDGARPAGTGGRLGRTVHRPRPAYRLASGSGASSTTYGSTRTGVRRTFSRFDHHSWGERHWPRRRKNSARDRSGLKR